jgi:competence ComEA-like helix-hairpin-helix protein
MTKASNSEDGSQPEQKNSFAGIWFCQFASVTVIFASLFWWAAHPVTEVGLAQFVDEAELGKVPSRAAALVKLGALAQRRGKHVKVAQFLVNINTADAATLQLLPNIGPGISEHIITYRQSHGGFSTIDELEAVKNIGPKTLAHLKRFVCLK